MSMDFLKATCPLPIMDHATIQLAHGSGGRMSLDLIRRVFLPHFANPVLNRLEDQAVLELSAGHIAFSTDTYVVDPIFFPGGNIGELAINGTINDVAMSGGRPLYLSAAFVIEEGFSMERLHEIVVSMARVGKAAGILVVTGDTKVVNRGSCDKIFINTSGVGVVPEGVYLSAANLCPGDKIVLSGTIADHGMAIMTCRPGLSFQSRIESDTAALNGLTETMLEVAKGGIRAMRDPTRGGVAASLNEWAETAGAGIKIEETTIPVRPEVQAACEILGIDPLYVANEGKLLAAVAPKHAQDVLAVMRAHPLGRNAVIIGEVTVDNPGLLVMTTVLGTTRIVDMPLGEQLPRIC